MKCPSCGAYMHEKAGLILGSEDMTLVRWTDFWMSWWRRLITMETTAI